MTYSLFLCGALFAAPPADDVFQVSAKLSAASLESGQQYDVQISWTLREGYSVSKGGLPAPILQIDPPKSVDLVGAVLTDHKALIKNEFLRAPFEVLLKETTTSVPFKITRRLKVDDYFAFNVLAYVGTEDGDDAWFVRRRINLPLHPDATSFASDATVSQWGAAKILQIGDKAKSFSLPSANGDKVSLKNDLLGEHNVIVMTYRAFW